MTDYLPMRQTSMTAAAAHVPSLESRETRILQARQAAQKLEATFLAEMLKAAGFGEQTNSLSGGIGEDQFASFHRQAVADKIAETGGLGLSEHFLKSMMEAMND